MENSEKLKRLRHRNCLSQQQLADLLGTSAGIIRTIEQGIRQPTLFFRDRFRKTFGVEYDSCDVNYQLIPQEDNNNNSFSDTESVKAASVNKDLGYSVPIPLIERSKLPGYQGSIPDVINSPKMYFDINYLKNILGVNPFNLILLYAQENENSFEENIREGDLLLIDRDKTAGLNKIFAVFVNNKDLKVRKIYQNLDGTFRISSENNISNEVVVIGQVIWNLSKGILI